MGPRLQRFLDEKGDALDADVQALVDEAQAMEHDDERAAFLSDLVVAPPPEASAALRSCAQHPQVQQASQELALRLQPLLMLELESQTP